MKDVIVMFILDLVSSTLTAIGITAIMCIAIDTYEVLALIYIAVFLFSLAWNSYKSSCLRDWMYEDEAELE